MPWGEWFTYLIQVTATIMIVGSACALVFGMFLSELRKK